MNKTYYINTVEGKRGQFSLEHLKEGIVKGFIQEETAISVGNTKKWVPAKVISELFWDNVVGYLIECGANIRAKNKREKTAKDMIINQFESEDVSEFMIPNIPFDVASKIINRLEWAESKNMNQCFIVSSRHES